MILTTKQSSVKQEQKRTNDNGFLQELLMIRMKRKEWTHVSNIELIFLSRVLKKRKKATTGRTRLEEDRSDNERERERDSSLLCRREYSRQRRGYWLKTDAILRATCSFLRIFQELERGKWTSLLLFPSFPGKTAHFYSEQFSASSNPSSCQEVLLLHDFNQWWRDLQRRSQCIQQDVQTSKAKPTSFPLFTIADFSWFYLPWNLLTSFLCPSILDPNSLFLQWPHDFQENGFSWLDCSCRTLDVLLENCSHERHTLSVTNNQEICWENMNPFMGMIYSDNPKILKAAFRNFIGLKSLSTNFLFSVKEWWLLKNVIFGISNYIPNFQEVWGTVRGSEELLFCSWRHVIVNDNDYVGSKRDRLAIIIIETKTKKTGITSGKSTPVLLVFQWRSTQDVNPIR